MKIVFPDAGSLGSDLDLSIFRKAGDFFHWENTAKEELPSRIREANVIITNRVNLGEAELKNAPDLALITLTATGYNNVDIEYCRKRKIAVANVAGYSTESVAQHTLAMLLYLLEHTRYYDDYIREQRYLADQRFADVSKPWNEIAGKNWGIIGMGSIGRKVASIAEAFGARVCYASTSGIKRDEAYEAVTLEELLRRSNIVSIHAPLNENTENLINRSRLSLMKKSAILLNLGRGAIVNEEDLIEALKSDKIGAAGLDVLREEPPQKDSDLLGLIDTGKLLVTPHNAWGSLESRRRLVREVFENIRAFAGNEKRNRIV